MSQIWKWRKLWKGHLQGMWVHLKTHHTKFSLYSSFVFWKFSNTFLPSSYSLFVSSSLDTSSAFWLKTHGLVARRLTIMDALAPTAVPHGTKYIPVLDKHVVSKVFDEVKCLCCFKVNINLCTVSKRIFFFFTNFHKFHNYIV